MKNLNLSSQSNSANSLILQSYLFTQQEVEREHDHSTSYEYEGTLQEIEMTINGFAESWKSLENIQNTSIVNDNEVGSLPSCETFTCSSGDSDSKCGEISSEDDFDSVASGFFSESGAKIQFIRLTMKHWMTAPHENHFQLKKKHACLFC